MQTTQLSCPHCGSMLNWGGEVPAGTQVTCLICMRPFAAAPVAASLVAAQAPAAPAAPKAPVAPRAARPKSVPTAKKAAPRPGILGRLIAVVVSVLLLAGAAVAVWKFNGHARHAEAEKGDEAIAVADTSQIKDTKSTNSSVVVKPSDPGGDKGKPAVSAEAGDDDVRQRKEAEKNLLKRKPNADVAEKEPAFDMVVKADDSLPIAPGVDAVSINAAVDRGIAFLKSTQKPDGSWEGGYLGGSAALAGLTMLECKTPADDPYVQKAAWRIRSLAASLDATYEISLAVLFLDRLGDPRDRGIIQGLALRLIAGQRDCGGWTYDCPLLTAPEMAQLFYVLQASKGAAKNKKALDLVAADARGAPETATFQELEKTIAKKANVPIGQLGPRLRQLPMMVNLGKPKAQHTLRLGVRAGDNSNTQFACLALWAARRHQIVSDSALLSAYQRFGATQRPDGRWGYHPNWGNEHASSSMTCVGLLGLAMGHGVSPQIVKGNADDPKGAVIKPALQDPRIKKALAVLATEIGNPADEKSKAGPVPNMYYLWSLERVCMLYDLKRIDGKDWYAWGAQILLNVQKQKGDWPSAEFPGATPHVNTCFALLVLKRSNLVQDLTVHLRMATNVRD